MAAAEYFMGTAAAQQLGNIRPPSYELPGHEQSTYQHATPQTQNQFQPYDSKPPPYPTQQQQPPPYPTQQYQPQQYQPQQYQPQQYQPQPPHGYQQSYPPPLPASYSPHPSTPQRQQAYPPPQHQQTANANPHLGVPLQHIRSHSQPPHVRFADDDDEYPTDSDPPSSDSSSSRRRHKRHHHHHHHHRSSDHDRDYDRGYDSDELRAAHAESRKTRDTFLGAGAGGVIGDAIFPGLGTVGGLLLGGYGGRKMAGKKGGERSRSRSRSVSVSDAGDDRDGHRHRHKHHREFDWR